MQLNKLVTRPPKTTASCVIKSIIALKVHTAQWRSAQISTEWQKKAVNEENLLPNVVLEFKCKQISVCVSDRDEHWNCMRVCAAVGVGRMCACLWETQRNFVRMSSQARESLSLPGINGEKTAAENVVHPCIEGKAYRTIKTEAVCCPALCGADWIRETATHSSLSQDIAGNYP